MAPPPCSIVYRLFGVRLAADRSIHGLVEAPESIDADICVHFDAAPPVDMPAPTDAPFYTSHIRGHEGRPFTTAWRLNDGAYIRLLISDGAVFVVDGQGREIWVHAPDVDASRVSEYLIGPVLGLALNCRGVVSLHASAVECDGGVVAFAGPEATGKSTIAALFARAGREAITDDLAALVDCGGAFAIHRGAPYLRVRRGAIESAAAADGFVISPDGEHLDLALGQRDGSASEPQRLMRVYWLRFEHAGATQPILIEPMRAHEALLALSADAWAARLLDARQREQQFDLLSRLIASVPVLRVTRAPGVSAAALRDAIERDLTGALIERAAVEGAARV